MINRIKKPIMPPVQQRYIINAKINNILANVKRSTNCFGSIYCAIPSIMSPYIMNLSINKSNYSSEKNFYLNYLNYY